MGNLLFHLDNIMNILEDEEKLELIKGVTNGFNDMHFFGRFLDLFMMGVRMKSTSSVDFILNWMEKEAAATRNIKPETIIRNMRNRSYENRLRSAFEKELQKIG